MSGSPPHPLRLLILGGTTEASQLAARLAATPAVAPILSLAGRTLAPAAAPIATRVGGFGGADGLARYLAETGISAVIDATHPFAARISAHAATACDRHGVPRAILTRPAWAEEPGDRWTCVADLAAAAAALGRAPRRVFLTTGRLGLATFRAAPQHDYLVRTIDPPAPADLPPRHRVILARGPFAPEAEAALMRQEGIAVLVTKNSGGTAGTGKLVAARTLGLPVILVARPAIPAGLVLDGLAAAERWIAGHAAPP